jgi:hypothetical protein
MTGNHHDSEDHELHYIAAASITVCEECGATFGAEDFRR